MRRSSFAAIAFAALALAGCKTIGDTLTTGSITRSAPAIPEETTDAGWRAIAERWRPAYDKNAGDANAAIAYGRALRKIGQTSQAVAVLQTAAAKNPQNQALLGEYGRALAASGDLDQAFQVLERAHSPDKPDWHILMAQGAVLDQMEKGDRAREYYNTALRIVPGEPSLLSNLGLSYMLSNDLPNAEKALRMAVANPRADAKARQNLALVLALEGNFSEAQTVASRDLGPDEAARSIASIRSMVAQPNSWQQLRQIGRRPPTTTPRIVPPATQPAG